MITSFISVHVCNCTGDYDYYTSAMAAVFTVQFLCWISNKNFVAFSFGINS